MKPQAAAIQMVSGSEPEANLKRAQGLLEQAVSQGASIAVLPENFALMSTDESLKLAHAEPQGGGRLTAFLQEIAARLGVWLIGGTLPYATQAAERVRAACLLVDDRGEIRSRYDKIHLFNVQFGQEGYQESATFEPGDRPVVASTPFGRVGLAVCYDLRFPELFRALVDGGADWFAVPSAFTQTTGSVHWEVLVRARAIEALVPIVAPDQGGEHPGGRRTFGHSMVVDPWGTVQDCLPDGEGVVLGPLDLERVQELRRKLPALEHRCL